MVFADTGNKYDLKDFDLQAMVQDLYKDGCKEEIIFLYTLANRLFYPFGFSKEMTEAQYMLDAIMEALRDMAADEDSSGIRFLYTAAMSYQGAKGKAEI